MCESFFMGYITGIVFGSLVAGTFYVLSASKVSEDEEHE